ncbi:uncharacterized protein CMU_018940 [Cryptosporidium muris RN66]|uniref:tRNA binding domain-containing protein n=1 Tax=Cryptosporidium muris (strain RN66) TaxID=441375 RepID=B6AC81_CRYMR|nr:uncharacterized protein CMU_018940 [Cryptosporidium muris RN66]EEA06137.1 hypothetical protein, conserved [Cryptosporidium muris RN66]|eukprot:XP_002140486.1 hypothetical protein [Cryptosporidium muris RN66]
MTIKLIINPETSFGTLLILVSNYIINQKISIGTEYSNQIASTLILESEGIKLINSVDILKHLGSIYPKIFKQDMEPVMTKFLELLSRDSFNTESDDILQHLEDQISGKSFFFGRFLSLLDLVVYSSIHSYFKSMNNMDSTYTPKYPSLSKFFEFVQIMTPIRQACPENLEYLDLPFFTKKLSNKTKKLDNTSDERSLDDPSRIELRVGKILSVERHPSADKLYVEKIDIGEEEPRTILSGLVGIYDLTLKINELVIVVANLKPKTMRGIISHGMLLCASLDGDTKLCEPIIVPNGAKVGELITYEGFSGSPDPVLSSKAGKDAFSTVQAHYNISNNSICRYKDIIMMSSAGPLYVNRIFAGAKLC